MDFAIVVRAIFRPLALVLAGALASVSTLGCGRPLERAVDAHLVPVLAVDPDEDPQKQLYWPSWRGANASGIVDATPGGPQLPIQWTTTRAIRWKITVPGRGNSSPVVCGNHVLLTTAMGDDEGSALAVCSFDRRNGALRWQADAGHARGGKHPKNSYASASVVTDGKRVYASFGSAGLFAFDLHTGQRHWHADVGQLDHVWGVASSPVLVGNLVVQLCDSETGSDLRSFNQETSKQVWRTPRVSTGAWSTPVPVDVSTVAGQPRCELIVNGTGAPGADIGSVIAYDPADGRELWRARGTTDVVCPTAIVSGGLVISTSGRNGPIFAIRPGGTGDVTRTNVVWKHARGGPYVPTGVAYRGRLYTVGDGGWVSCFNLQNGDDVWRKSIQGAFSASLIAGDGHLYAANEDGVVYVLAAGDRFRLVATNDMQEEMLATPAAALGDLFLRTQTQLYCVAGRSDDLQANVELTEK